jgi:hypothetical protein
MPGDGSHVAVNIVSALLYFDKQGHLLWRYDSPNGTIGPISMSMDGRYILLSISNIMDHNPVMEWKIVYLDTQGSTLWSFIGTNAIVEDSALSEDGSLVVVGASVDGWNGMVYMFNNLGHILWKRPISSAILPVVISGDDSAVIIGTNWGITAFDSSGGLLWNFTGGSAGSLAVTVDGSQVLAGLWTTGPSILLFNASGEVAWSYPAGPIHQVAISSSGMYGIIAAGTPTLGPYSWTSARVYFVSLPSAETGQSVSSTIAPVIVYFVLAVLVSVVALFTARRYRQRLRSGRQIVGGRQGED